MRDINNVTIIGRLTKDPEVKYTSTGMAICNISIANNSGTKEKPEVSYFDVIAFGKIAETCAKYLKKGSQISVSGYLRQNRWQNSEGKTMSRVEIVANGVQFIGGQKTDAPVSNQSDNPWINQ